jgi:putative CocE/NonD family hydrolase
MTVQSWALARVAKLPPAESRHVEVERDLEVKTPDGEVLLADRWFAPATVASAPIVLMRSPYGRRQLGVLGRLFAERGYQAVIQSCRGTFGSSGGFEPFHEQSDGVATLEWLASQSWFTGSVGTFGPSYLGLTQWSVGATAPEFLRAMALDFTASRFRESVVYPGDSFALETGVAWVDFMEIQERGSWARVRAIITASRRAAPAFTTLPLSQVDQRVHGRRIGFYQDWLDHELPGDPWWQPLDFSKDLDRVPPASLLAGWYDLFLREQVADFERLRDAGREVRLTIGPWTHTSPKAGGAGLRDALDWFDRRLRSRSAAGHSSAVRVYVMGSDRWVSLPVWPPPAEIHHWHFHAGGLLDPRAPDAAAPDRYRYDPADPTPGIGGASLDMRNSGPRDQRRREERPDVLCYTTGALGADLTVAGALEARIWVRSSHPHVDVFARLCDVDPSGRSRNVSDGLIRLDEHADQAATDGIRQVRVAMSPTAMTFRRGHRVRLQVSGGAHPLYARNTGSGERLGSATTLVPSDVEVWHDPAHPSLLELPVSPI